VEPGKLAAQGFPARPVGAAERRQKGSLGSHGKITCEEGSSNVDDLRMKRTRFGAAKRETGAPSMPANYDHRGSGKGVTRPVVPADSGSFSRRWTRGTVSVETMQRRDPKSKWAIHGCPIHR
jgi:hypothetical protein